MNTMNDLYLLLSNVECRSCGEHRDPDDISVLGHKEDVWLFSMPCSSCDSQGLISVNIKTSEEP